MSSVLEVYEAELASRGYLADAVQLEAVAALERCAQQWAQYRARRSNALKKLLFHPPLPSGVYLCGGVGRGKSFLMDCFYRSVPIVRKTRLHFHEFMREVHHELARLQGTVDPLDELGKRMAQRFKLLCFDEFHIASIVDAMILYRLLASLLDNDVGFVTTSNFLPDDLYPDGLNREAILPAIDLLKRRMQIIDMGAAVDYRLKVLAQGRIYLTPLGPESEREMLARFDQLATRGDEDCTLLIEARTLTCKRRAGKLVWFDFKTLCEGFRSKNDYLEIASRFDTVLLSDVPKMGQAAAAAARRFTLLVDVLYDRHVKLILSAAVPASELYTQGPLAHEFPRTVSRLAEMQTQPYLALEHRAVDTGLT